MSFLSRSRGISKSGVSIETVNCELSSASEVAEIVSKSDGFVVGSPTLGGHMPTPVQVNVTELLEVNKALFHEKAHGPMKDWVPLARYDDITSQKLNISRALNEGDTKHVKKILNDSEYSKFRTSDLKA